MRKLFKIFKIFVRLFFLIFIFSFFYSYPVYIIKEDLDAYGKKLPYNKITLEEIDKEGHIIDSIKINQGKIFEIESIYFDKTMANSPSATVKIDGKIYSIDDPFKCYDIFSIETECNNKNVWDFIIGMPIALVLRAPVCFVQSYLYNKKFDDCNFLD